MTRKPLLLFGAGGLAADVFDIVMRVGGMSVAGFAVDQPSPSVHPAPVFQWDEVRERSADFLAVNAMGRPNRKGFIEKAEAAGFEFISLIDPSAQIFPSAAIAQGCVVGAGTIVAASASIGRHVYLNRGVIIGHHTIIEPFVSVQAGARVGGHGHLAGQVEVGIGATIIDRIKVAERTVIGAGAVVVRDCPADATMVGVPAREIKR